MKLIPGKVDWQEGSYHPLDQASNSQLDIFFLCPAQLPQSCNSLCFTVELSEQR